MFQQQPDSTITPLLMLTFVTFGTHSKHVSFLRIIGFTNPLLVCMGPKLHKNRIIPYGFLTLFFVSEYILKDKRPTPTKNMFLIDKLKDTKSQDENSVEYSDKIQIDKDKFLSSLLESLCVNMYAHTPNVYLFQRGIRNTIAGQAKVSHSQVKLLEKSSKGPISGSTVGQYEGDFLTDAFQKDSLRDMAPHKLCHSCQICFMESHKINQNTDTAGRKACISPLIC